ncbi:MAG: hypothetical protein ABIF18_02505 [archaeon]
MRSEVAKLSPEVFFVLIFVFFALSFVSAQNYSIDISGLNSEEYNIGEEIVFKVILLEDGIPVSKQVDYKISDALKKKELTGQVNSTEDVSIKVEEDFLSGLWTIVANYSNSKVERTFLVGEKSEIEFIIQGDELIIRNIGNVRYTKAIQIAIGTETNTYAQNIRAGDEKILKLISADGIYNIEVTDGTTTVKRENVQLFGVGNVVGAVDRNLVGYTGFAGADDLENIESQFASLEKLPLSLIFVAAVGILTALTFVERRLSKKKKKV